jgi:hypothetical protein
MHHAAIRDVLKERFVEGGKAALDADAPFFGGLGPVEEVQRHVPDGGKVGGAIARSDAAFVFAQDDVEDPMQAVLDAPMLACGTGEPGGVRSDRADVEAGLAGSRLAGLLAHGLDHGDAGQIRPLRMALAQPGDVAGDPVAAKLDAAMIGIGRLMGGPASRGAIFEAGGALLAEEIGDVAMKSRLVVLERQQVIGAPVANSGGDLLLAADGIDGDDGALEIQQREKLGDGGDLVLLGADGELTQHQALPGRPGRDHVDRPPAVAAIERTSQRLAVNRHDLPDVLLQRCRPGDEGRFETLPIEGVEDVREGVMARNALGKGQKASQKIELGLTVFLDFDPSLRAAQHSDEAAQQELRQWIEHLRLLPRLRHLEKPKPAQPVTNPPSHRKPPQQEILDTFFRRQWESRTTFRSSDHPGIGCFAQRCDEAGGCE